MSDYTFIWKSFFEKRITPTHPAVYQYIMGKERSKESAIMRVTEEIYELCNPEIMGDETINIVYIRGIARKYMDFMHNQWIKGKIIPKEIYQIPV